MPAVVGTGATAGQSRRVPVIRRSAMVTAAAVLALSVAGCSAGSGATLDEHSSRTPGINGSAHGMAIRNAFILGPEPGGVLTVGDDAPVYFGLANRTGTADQLVSVTSAGLAAATKINGGDVPVGPRGSVRVGKKHTVILRGLTRALKGVETVPLTFTFARAGSVTLDTPVLDRSNEFASDAPAPAPSPSGAPTTGPTTAASSAAPSS